MVLLYFNPIAGRKLKPDSCTRKIQTAPLLIQLNLISLNYYGFFDLENS